MKVFKIQIDDNEMTGMNCISLVEQPAVEVDFLAFSKEQGQELCLTQFNEEKREITGVVCLADTPILRKNKEYGVHYILFEKDTIKKMMLKYFKNGFGNQVNIEHKGPFIEGVTMIESYIKDSNRNVSPIEFEAVPDGSWIATFKVENEDVWNKIKEEHSLKGFSLQGMFYYGECIEMSRDDYDTWLEDILK